MLRLSLCHNQIKQEELLNGWISDAAFASKFKKESHIELEY